MKSISFVKIFLLKIKICFVLATHYRTSLLNEIRQESKRKRLQFEKSLFLPNNKKRKNFRSLFNKKSLTPNETKQTPNNNNFLNSKKINKQPAPPKQSSKDSDSSESSKKSDKSSSMKRRSFYSEKMCNGEFNEKEETSSPKKLGTEYVSFRTTGNKLKIVQKKLFKNSREQTQQTELLGSENIETTTIAENPELTAKSNEIEIPLCLSNNSVQLNQAQVDSNIESSKISPIILIDLTETPKPMPSDSLQSTTLPPQSPSISAPYISPYMPSTSSNSMEFLMQSTPSQASTTFSQDSNVESLRIVHNYEVKDHTAENNLMEATPPAQLGVIVSIDKQPIQFVPNISYIIQDAEVQSSTNVRYLQPEIKDSTSIAEEAKPLEAIQNAEYIQQSNNCAQNYNDEASSVNQPTRSNSLDSMNQIQPSPNNKRHFGEISNQTEGLVETNGVSTSLPTMGTQSPAVDPENLSIQKTFQNAPNFNYTPQQCTAQLSTNQVAASCCQQAEAQPKASNDILNPINYLQNMPNSCRYFKPFYLQGPVALGYNSHALTSASIVRPSTGHQQIMQVSPNEVNQKDAPKPANNSQETTNMSQHFYYQKSNIDVSNEQNIQYSYNIFNNQITASSIPQNFVNTPVDASEKNSPIQNSTTTCNENSNDQQIFENSPVDASKQNKPTQYSTKTCNENSKASQTFGHSSVEYSEQNNATQRPYSRNSCAHQMPSPAHASKQQIEQPQQARQLDIKNSKENEGTTIETPPPETTMFTLTTTPVFNGSSLSNLSCPPLVSDFSTNQYSIPSFSVVQKENMQQQNMPQLNMHPQNNTPNTSLVVNSEQTNPTQQSSNSNDHPSPSHAFKQIEQPQQSRKPPPPETTMFPLSTTPIFNNSSFSSHSYSPSVSNSSTNQYSIPPSSAFQKQNMHQQNMHQQNVKEYNMRLENMRQEKMRQENIRLENLRQENIRQEKLLQENTRLENIRQEKIRLEKLRQEELNQEKQRQENIRLENLLQEQIRLEKLRQENMREEKLHQRNMRQKALRDEKLRQKNMQSQNNIPSTTNFQPIPFLHKPIAYPNMFDNAPKNELPKHPMGNPPRIYNEKPYYPGFQIPQNSSSGNRTEYNQFPYDSRNVHMSSTPSVNNYDMRYNFNSQNPLWGQSKPLNETKSHIPTYPSADTVDPNKWLTDRFHQTMTPNIRNDKSTWLARPEASFAPISKNSSVDIDSWVTARQQHVANPPPELTPEQRLAKLELLVQSFVQNHPKNSLGGDFINGPKNVSSPKPPPPRPPQPPVVLQTPPPWQKTMSNTPPIGNISMQPVPDSRMTWSDHNYLTKPMQMPGNTGYYGTSASSESPQKNYDRSNSVNQYPTSTTNVPDSTTGVKPNNLSFDLRSYRPTFHYGQQYQPHNTAEFYKNQYQYFNPH